MRLSRLCYLFLVSLLLGCAHNIQKNCTEADYYKMGLGDGNSGKTRDQLAEAKARCEKVGIPVAEDRYIYGYKVGLANFCNEGKARSDARALAPRKVCMDERVPPYMTAYKNELGTERAKKEKRIGKLEKSRADLQNQENKLQSDVKRIDQQKASDQPSSF
jgi:hypothetical protein